MRTQVKIEPTAAENAQGYPDLEVMIETKKNGVQLTILAPDGHTHRASVWIEYYNGALSAYVYDEDDQDQDQTAHVILIDDPRQPPPEA